MKKAILILTSGILGAMFMTGFSTHAQAKRSYRGNSRSHRTVSQRTYRRTTRVVYRNTARSHRYAVGRTIRRVVRTIHRVVHPRRSYLTTYYTLKPYIGFQAQRRLNRWYNGNVQSFCASNPGYCYLHTRRVFY